MAAIGRLLLFTLWKFTPNEWLLCAQKRNDLTNVLRRSVESAAKSGSSESDTPLDCNQLSPAVAQAKTATFAPSRCNDSRRTS